MQTAFNRLVCLLVFLSLAGSARAFAADVKPFGDQHSDYHGFNRFDLKIDGRSALVVVPKKAMDGNPWIWRAEFFDHQPQIDLALLDKGFHLAYIDVGNTFGCPDAMAHWEVFYKALTEDHGLSKHPVLEGLSRGGLYVYNFAGAHPDQVGAIIGDNPVCDFKSWPGGKGKGPGSAGDWKELINDYHFKDEAEALAYTKNPIDYLKPLADAKIPLFHLAADADEVVPYEENTVILKERYEKLGGKMTVIVKHGGKHHPHGLDDPAPAVKWVMENVIGIKGGEK